jgi:hypothetical protein
MRQSGDEKPVDQTEIALILLDIPALEGSHPQELFYRLTEKFHLWEVFSKVRAKHGIGKSTNQLSKSPPPAS